MNDKQVHECNLFPMMSFLIKLDKFVSLSAGSSVVLRVSLSVFVCAFLPACRFDLPADGNVLHFYKTVSLSVSLCKAQVLLLLLLRLRLVCNSA